MEEQTLYSEHPSMFRNAPVGFVLSCLLSVVGVGLIILLVWWLRCRGTLLTITDKRTILRRGLLSKHVVEVLHSHVRSVETHQTFFQRLFSVGTIGIATPGTEGVEVQVSGLPNPDEIRRLIDQHRGQ